MRQPWDPAEGGAGAADPSPAAAGGAPSPAAAYDWQDFGSKSTPTTPRQKLLSDRLDLPRMQVYPVPPGCSQHEQEHEKRRQLLEMYQGFALEMHRGMYLTQLMADLSYQDIHCQLMEDMATLKLDQSNGRIIEFPLANVSKVYRIVKNNDKWYTAGTPLPGSSPNGNTEQIVVVEFMRRKLAFVFKEVLVSQRFLTC